MIFLLSVIALTISSFLLYIRSLYLNAKRTVPTTKEKQKFLIVEHSKEKDGKVIKYWTLKYLVQYKNNSKMVEFEEEENDSLGYSGMYTKHFKSKVEAELQALHISQTACELNENGNETPFLVL